MTVAGTGSSAYTGDGGPATLAMLYTPNAAAPDGLGGFWIADTGNHALRRVMPFSQCYRLGVVQLCTPWFSGTTTWILCSIAGMSPAPPVYAWLGPIVSANTSCSTFQVRLEFLLASYTTCWSCFAKVSNMLLLCIIVSVRCHRLLRMERQ